MSAEEAPLWPSTRLLGRTGISASRIGVGTWQLGGADWGPFDRLTTEAAVHAALEMGVTLFDTAQAYGEGRSEERLGRILETRDEPVVVVTKVGWDGDFRPRSIRQRLLESLRRLRREQVDIYLLHSPPPEVAADESVVEAFLKLKEAALIRAWGVAARSYWSRQQAMWIPALCGELRDVQLAPELLPDVVELVYGPLDVSAGNSLSSLAERGVGVIVRNVLASGLIGGRYRSGWVPPEGDFRRQLAQRWRDVVIERAHKLHLDAEQAGSTPASLAIRFALEHPAIDVAIIGVKTSDQVREALEGAALAHERTQRIATIFAEEPSLRDYEAWARSG